MRLFVSLVCSQIESRCVALTFYILFIFRAFIKVIYYVSFDFFLINQCLN